MATVTVKLFGVLRVDSGLAAQEVNAARVQDIFGILNDEIEKQFAQRAAQSPKPLEKPEPLAFKDAIVFINGERCKRKGHALADGDEVWLMSPASGG